METMSEKVGAMGGNMGSPFDDGVFDGVNKIIVGKDFDSVSYIKIEYEKDGRFETREHGTIRGELKEFTVDYPDEYITAVGGSYERVYSYGTVLIKSLIFKTSYGRTSPILGHTTLLGNPSGIEFMLEGKNGGKLLGFHGRSGQALDAIGPHFFAVNSLLKHFNCQGGNGGSAWDDGAFDGVRKVLIGRSGKFVSYVRFEYAKGERMVPHAHGKRQEVPQEFVVDYPDEHITSVEGTIDGYLTSIRFKTSKGRTSSAFGNVVGRKFVFEEKDFKLVGFCGRSGDAIDALGAHFGPLPPPTPAPAPALAPATTKMEPIGGNKGNTFDDGIFDGVKKITVGVDEYSVTYIKIEYEKEGKVVLREHGTSRGELKEFFVDYSKEYITAVGGSYNHIFNYDTTLITSIYFTTSRGFTSPLFGKKKGTDFNLKGENGGKLLGFHGRGGFAIDALGAHFAPVSSSSSSLTPPNKGNHNSVSKIYITSGYGGIEQIKFYSVENGETKEGIFHDVKGKNLISTFVISNTPDEYLVCVESWYDSSNAFQGIKFKTDTNSSDFFGYKFSEDDGTPFSLQVKDKKIIGFHKLTDTKLNSPGTYFVLIRSSSLIKVEAQGATGGETFDDGAFDHVRKVYVGQGDSGVAYIKFEYEKDGKRETREHGKKTILGTEDFEVDQDDYITSVKVFYDKIFGSDTEVITSVTFKTYKGIISQPFGMSSANMFFLEGGKITGFHGSSSNVLHSLGAYISRSATPMLRGKWIKVEQKNKGPGPRCSHAIAMVGEKMYSFGGELTPNFHIDRHLYVFDFKTHTWSLAPPNGDVPELPCLGVRMEAIGTTLYFFGGRDGHRNYNGFYSYDTVKNEWKLITHVDKGPAPRSFHAMAADDKNVYVFGGVSTTVRVNTLHAYNIVDQKWIELPNPGESCKGRGGSGLAVVQGKIWVVYGFIGDEVDDVYCFDPVESKWTKVETSGEKPWPRSVFALAVVGKYIIISGGENEMDPKAHLGPGKLDGGAFVLDTESLLWEKLEEGHSPRGWCASTTASIDGKKGLLMYGGKAPTNGRYDDIFFYGVDSA